MSANDPSGPVPDGSSKCCEGLIVRLVAQHRDDLVAYSPGFYRTQRAPQSLSPAGRVPAAPHAVSQAHHSPYPLIVWSSHLCLYDYTLLNIDLPSIIR
jgi:hypothetical protein